MWETLDAMLSMMYIPYMDQAKLERNTEMTKREEMMQTVAARIATGYSNVGTKDGFFGEIITTEMCDEWIKRNTRELVVLADTTDAQYDAVISAIHKED